jgi:hypothetical protein
VCDQLRTNWTNAGMRGGLFCLYYDSSNASAQSVMSGTNRVFRNNITLPSLLFPNYTFLEIYAIANFSTGTSFAGQRIVIGTFPLWGPFYTAGLNPSSIFYRANTYPSTFAVEIFTSASTFTTLRSITWAGVFYQIDRCINFTRGSELCFGCDLGYILNRTSFKSCYTNISRCDTYVPGTASNLNCSRC